MLVLQIFRGALLGGGGLALGNGIALSYGGGHKVVTYVGWYLLAGLLLAAGVVFWVEIHRRKEAADESSGAATAETRPLTYADLAAIRVPVGHDQTSLPSQIDDLIRKGRELVSELSAPVQPEKLNWVSKIVGGGPPVGWQEKADAFRQRSMDLLEAQHPALLTDFRDGIKRHFAMEREAKEQREQESGADARSAGEKTLALANHERSGPRREVEACLEGLALGGTSETR